MKMPPAIATRSLPQTEPDLLPVAARLDGLDVLAELAVGLDRDRGREAGAGGEQIPVVRRGHAAA